MDKVITAEGAPNIAFIKYWGKRDERLILPFNSSLSMTFEHKAMRTVTSVVLSKRLAEDVFFLDGKMQNLKNKEIQERFGILNQLRAMANTETKMLVVSRNYFPTASGLASSASGIATLVYAANSALELNLSAKEMSVIARQGSGSACRSLFGGIVVWNKGSRADGKDSFAEQVFDSRYWPELVDNIVVVSDVKKKVSSRAGMGQTVKTNPLFKARPESAERRLRLIKEAYKKKDISEVAKHMIADSNEMHALMLSTTPSIRYLNPASYAIMSAIEELNDSEGRIIAGYTFDAGPNANIVTIGKYQKKVLEVIGPFEEDKQIQYMKTSKVGEGPKLLNVRDSMIDVKTLKPG